MKKLFVFLLFILMIPVSYGQGSSATASPIAINQYGKPIGTAIVTICTTNPFSGTCSSLVPTYTDNTLGTLCTGTGVALNNLQFPSTGSGCSNPGRVDNFGNVVSFASPGFYWCQYSGAGFVPYSQPCVFPALLTGGSATWGAIVGTISNQTDLWNYLQNFTLSSSGLVLAALGGGAGHGNLGLSNSSTGIIASLSDGTGNSLFLGQTSPITANFNLTNLHLQGGIINTTSNTTYVYGNPLQIGVNPGSSTINNITNGFQISGSGTTVVGPFTLSGTTTGCLNTNGSGLVASSPCTLQSTVTLTASQFNALNGTGTILFPAPGANLVIIPITVTIIYKFGSAAFTVPSGATLTLSTGVNAGVFGPQDLGGFLDNTSSSILINFPSLLNDAEGALSTYVNTPVVATVLNGPTSSGTGSVVEITMSYQLVPIL